VHSEQQAAPSAQSAEETDGPVGPPFCVRGSRSSSSLRQSVLGASGAAANPEALAEPPAMGAGNTPLDHLGRN